MNASRKEIILIVLVVVLGGVYVWGFTDWFRTKFIRVEHTVRSLREAWTSGGQRVDPAGKMLNDVTFSLHKDYRLTSVRVVPLAEFRTNRYPHAVWHLVCKAGAPPVNGFAYGTPIPGMTLAAPNTEAQPLEPGVEYRLLVEAGSIKGTNDFSLPVRSASR